MNDEIRVNGRLYDHLHWTRINDVAIDAGMGESDDSEESEFKGKICILGRNNQGFFDQLSKYMDVEEYFKNKERWRECIMEYKGG